MATTLADPRSSAGASAVALGLATGAAIALAAADAVWFGIPTADGPGVTLLYVVGWLLLAWAAVVALATVVHLVRSASAGRRQTPLEIVLIAAALAVVVGVLLAHPMFGSGQGFGSALG